MKLVRCDRCGSETEPEWVMTADGWAKEMPPTGWHKLRDRDLCHACTDRALQPMAPTVSNTSANTTGRIRENLPPPGERAYRV